MDGLGGFVSLLLAIGTGYMNDNRDRELILGVGHFYVASYSRNPPPPKKKKHGRPFIPVAPCYCCYLP